MKEISFTIMVVLAVQEVHHQLLALPYFTQEAVVAVAHMRLVQVELVAVEMVAILLTL
jgi:hypothetical protein